MITDYKGYKIHTMCDSSDTYIATVYKQISFPAQLLAEFCSGNEYEVVFNAQKWICKELHKKDLTLYNWLKQR